jgi:hypothetical protein
MSTSHFAQKLQLSFPLDLPDMIHTCLLLFAYACMQDAIGVIIIAHDVHSPACRFVSLSERVPSTNTDTQAGNKSMLHLRLQKVIIKCLLHSGSAKWIRMQQAPNEPCCRGVLSDIRNKHGQTFSFNGDSTACCMCISLHDNSICIVSSKLLICVML